jgi:RimJ/RimL family protein N-acetyltransferase
MTALPGAAALASGAPLEAGRLRLRMFREGDLDGLAAMYGDAETMRHIGDGRVLTREETWRAIAGMLGHWAMRGYGMWALELGSTGELVGRVGFIDPPGWPGFELGWLVARPHWGKGYATEAARVALGHAVEGLGRDRVISLVRPGNRASARVAAKIGMRVESTLDFLGGPVEVHAYAAR